MARFNYIPNRVIDTDGISDGASIYVYQTGTTTPISLYLDAAYTVPTTNPFVVVAGAAVPSLYYDFAGDIRVRIVSTSGAVEDYDPYDIVVYTSMLTGIENDINGYSTRAEIKALTAAAGRRAYLTEAGRQGTFVFKAGNYTTRVTADTQEGIYLEADNIAASAGAWVRDLPMKFWFLSWFGVPDDPAAGNGGGSEVQCHLEMIAAVDIANIDKPSRIMFDSCIYTLGAAIPEWNFQIELIGARGVQGTIICKRYVEGNATRGVFAFNNHGFTIDKITFRASSGSGGSGISAKLTTASPAAGRTYLIDTYVSVGDYCNYSLHVDGSINTTSGSASYRGLFIRGGEFFGAAIASIWIKSAQHVLVAGAFCTDTGGTGTIALQTDGSTNAYNDDWQWHGVISGVVYLNFFGGGPISGGLPSGGRSTFISPLTDNLYVDANCLSTTWVGSRSGTPVIANLAGDGFVFSHDGTIVDNDNNVTAGYIIFGNGKIFQWGTVTTVAGEALANVLPIAFTSSNIQYGAQPTTMPAANVVTNANIVKTAANPLTQFDIRAYNFNFSTGAYAANAAPFRWSANGQ